MNATLEGANEIFCSYDANVLHADANENMYAYDVNLCSWNV